MITRILDSRVFDRMFDWLYDLDAARTMRCKERYKADREALRKARKEGKP